MVENRKQRKLPSSPNGSRKKKKRQPLADDKSAAGNKGPPPGPQKPEQTQEHQSCGDVDKKIDEKTVQKPGKTKSRSGKENQKLDGKTNKRSSGTASDASPTRNQAVGRHNSRRSSSRRRSQSRTKNLNRFPLPSAARKKKKEVKPKTQKSNQKPAVEITAEKPLNKPPEYWSKMRHEYMNLQWETKMTTPQFGFSFGTFCSKEQYRKPMGTDPEAAGDGKDKNKKPKATAKKK